MQDRVAIIGGTGALGSGLACRWLHAGVEVVIGSRSAERAQDAADQLGAATNAAALGMSNREAAAAAPIVVLAMPFAAHAEHLRDLADSLEASQLVVDCTVPLATAVGGRPTRSVGVWSGSAAEQAQELVPDGVHVVAALHTVGAAKLANLSVALSEDILVCGDRRRDKASVAGLIERIAGLRAVNAGSLEMARIVEQLTPLLISVNSRHRVHAGIRLTDLPEGPLWDSDGTSSMQETARVGTQSTQTT